MTELDVTRLKRLRCCMCGAKAVELALLPAMDGSFAYFSRCVRCAGALGRMAARALPIGYG